MLVAGLLAGAALAAQDLPDDGRAEAVPDTILADLNGDGLPDRATLVPNETLMTVDLVIETGEQTERGLNIAFSGGAEGQVASLLLTPDGALELRSGNLSLGRARWDQAMTVSWHDGAFRVASVTRSWWDTLTPDSDGNCEIDFIEGRGRANGAQGSLEIRLEDPAPELADWTGHLPEGCAG